MPIVKQKVFFWARLPHEVPALIAGFDALLPVLCARLYGDAGADGCMPHDEA
jgi:hypothetical protein